MTKPWKPRVADARASNSWEIANASSFMALVNSMLSKGKGKGRYVSRDQGDGSATGKAGGKGAKTASHCTCCGNSGHHKRECYHVKKQCNKCARTGHLAHMCTASDPVPSQEPREHVPGLPRKTYAEATKMTPWTCPICTSWMDGALVACQQVNCKGKRPTVKTTPEAKESTLLSKNFLKLGPAIPVTDSDTVMVDTEQQGKEDQARALIAMLKTMGMDSMLAEAESNLQAVLAARPAAPEADPRTAMTCESERFRLNNVLKQWKADNERAKAAEVEKMCKFEKDTLAFRENEIARHKRDLEAIDTKARAAMEGFKQSTEEREQRYLQNLAKYQVDVARIDQALHHLGNREAIVEEEQDIFVEVKSGPEVDIMLMDRKGRDAIWNQLVALKAKEHEETATKEKEMQQASEHIAEEKRRLAEVARMLGGKERARTRPQTRRSQRSK
jgi:hypothetical protein